MLKEQPFPIKRSEAREQSTWHFALPGLLSSGQQLALHRETHTLSLLAPGPELLAMQQFTTNELRILLPILESFPHYCPYEVLLSHLASSNATMSSSARWRCLLQEAQVRGTWQQELRPLRRALTSLRVKLRVFHLDVSTLRERGCGLTNARPQ